MSKKSDDGNWDLISSYQKLSEEFIRESQYKVNWDLISSYQKLSEEFIEEFQHKVNWNYVSSYQKLSEEFIEEFQHKVNWNYVSKYQKLSEEFIWNYKDKINLECISKYQKLSKHILKLFGIRIKNIKNNWLYQSKEFKKEWIKKNTSYKIKEGDYILAWKGIRHDRHSNYNFQYQYLKDGIYERHCDCNLNNENSFGLSATRTKKKAKEYCDELIIQVKIKIEDIGAIVHSGHKIRCNRFEVIS